MSAGAFLLSQRKSEAPWSWLESSGLAGFHPVKEIASGVNDRRPKLLALLKDTSGTHIVVEHQDRLTRFGFDYLEALLQAQGRTIEVVNLAENDNEDLIADLVAITERGPESPGFGRGMNGLPPFPVLLACGRMSLRTACTLPTKYCLGVPW